MRCSATVKLPPATTWLTVGSLCLCSCTVPFYVDEPTSTGSTGAPAGDTDTPTTTAPPTTTDYPAASSSSEATEPGLPETTSSSTSSDGPMLDVGAPDDQVECAPPPGDCDADSDALDHALGVNCAGGISSLAVVASGPPDSVKVVEGPLGSDATFAPRLGSRAVLLTTGVASHVALDPDELVEIAKCSEIGLPCPNTDHDPTYDLAMLPPPLQPAPIICPQGQLPPGPGDCSATIDKQWLGEPQVAHDYSELRLTATAPLSAVGVSLQAAFFTAEWPTRSAVVSFANNDLFVVWFESEQWTGNIAVHPEQLQPFAAGTLAWDHAQDAALAGFAFAEHVAIDWTELTAAITPGETITLVLAIFDVGDGKVDSAVLLDDLRWTCAIPNGGPRHQ